MKIEEAIKSRKFSNSMEKAIVNVLYTYGWLFNLEKDFFKQFGLTPQQYNVLRILNGQYPKSISTCDIKERMLDRNSDASRLVDRMYASGIVERTISEIDRRKVDIRISERGRDLLDEISSNRQYYHTFNEVLTDEEAETLSVLLDKLRSSEENNSFKSKDCEGN